MEKDEKKTRLKVLYIGSSKEPVQILNNSGLFNVIQIDTSIEAINYLRTQKDTDAIIAETKIYFSDGFQIRRLLEKKEKDFIKTTPYILISMAYDEKMSMRALRAGIDDHYLFPVDPQRIYNRIIDFKNHPEQIGVLRKVSKDTNQGGLKYETPLLKRIFDITFAGLALLFLSPLMLLVIIAIKLDSKGPFYYTSKRIGANMNDFGFLKFRSMKVNADQLLSKKDLAKLNQYATKTIKECPGCANLPKGEFCGDVTKGVGENEKGEEIEVEICSNLVALRKEAERNFTKLENDPRITRVGKFIRNTSIDELPQLINIIKGDMSIVGNRPLPVVEADIISIDKADVGEGRTELILEDLSEEIKRKVYSQFPNCTIQEAWRIEGENGENIFEIKIRTVEKMDIRPRYNADGTFIDFNLERNWRFIGAAGLTGLWQVELRGQGGEMSREERFSLDSMYAFYGKYPKYAFGNKYAKYTGFWGDIRLILRTVKVFIQRGDV
jgi:lipopolysaccharide/colanic/teichoic acid biosynthesis glycosyltransferase